MFSLSSHDIHYVFNMCVKYFLACVSKWWYKSGGLSGGLSGGTNTKILGKILAIILVSKLYIYTTYTQQKV